MYLNYHYIFSVERKSRFRKGGQRGNEERKTRLRKSLICSVRFRFQNSCFEIYREQIAWQTLNEIFAVEKFTTDHNILAPNFKIIKFSVFIYIFLLKFGEASKMSSWERCELFLLLLCLPCPLQVCVVKGRAIKIKCSSMVCLIKSRLITVN